MTAAESTHSLGPGNGRLLVKTGRTGVGSKAGHDLTIEVTRWEGAAAVDTGDPGRSWVTVEAQVDSMTVVEGTGGVKPLTEGDRTEIRKALREKVLRPGTHPTIAFRSTEVEGSPEAFTVRGDLTVVAVTKPVTLHGSVRDAGTDSARAQGSTTFPQSDWGIKPYSAFFGALKLADEVTVEFDVSLAG